ncbi:MAG: hypothetical protein LBE35_05960 [Clostridiales bacterium]|jgi:hypothetical protein|nr:hypothetical protein [Clostridiales bacterium]
MTTDFEIRRRDRQHLASLLKMKRTMLGIQNIPELSHALNAEIRDVIAGMLEEDVALVEKLYEVKALN